MKILVSIKNNLSQIRVIPSLGGTILSVLNKDLETDYTATLMYKGWYYLSEINQIFMHHEITDSMLMRVVYSYTQKSPC